MPGAILASQRAMLYSWLSRAILVNSRLLVDVFVTPYLSTASYLWIVVGWHGAGVSNAVTCRQCSSSVLPWHVAQTACVAPLMLCTCVLLFLTGDTYILQSPRVIATEATCMLRVLVHQLGCSKLVVETARDKHLGSTAQQ